MAGPKRPQDRIDLRLFRQSFATFSLRQRRRRFGTREQLDDRFPVELCGVGNEVVKGGEIRVLLQFRCRFSDKKAVETNVTTEVEMINNRPTPDGVEVSAEDCPPQRTDIGHGDVLIAAITSCTNTSNPSVMIAAGLVAKKASERGMRVPGYVKTSLAPGSRVVTDYLEKTGLQEHLDAVGFNLVGYGCTTYWKLRPAGRRDRERDRGK